MIVTKFGGTSVADVPAITRLVGKIKAGQNREMVDREGAITGLRSDGDPGDGVMADVMEAILPR